MSAVAAMVNGRPSPVRTLLYGRPWGMSLSDSTVTVRNIEGQDRLHQLRASYRPELEQVILDAFYHRDRLRLEVERVGRGLPIIHQAQRMHDPEEEEEEEEEK